MPRKIKSSLLPVRSAIVPYYNIQVGAFILYFDIQQYHEADLGNELAFGFAEDTGTL